jgi:long-subunit acyl-CoA synthetase (AMP-forming)
MYLPIPKLQKIAVILFTSGSESLPKAVALTHNNILTDIK